VARFAGDSDRQGLVTSFAGVKARVVANPTATEEDLEGAAQRPIWSERLRIKKITVAASLASTERFRS
jgi:hypothetical protein